ncbi:MAG: hypothetical protein RQ714_06555 [Nitrosomonas sp.]|nr:hypothetical protein [Nitrosomonas sp.]
MTLIELVNDLRREASVSGSAVTTAVNQTGENRRLVEWVKRAYTEIQNIFFDWRFLRVHGTFTTTAGNNTITAPADLNIYDVSRFFDDEGRELEIFQEEEVDWYLNPNLSGRPEYIIIKSDNNLRLYPTPDAAYSYTYDYFRVPFELVADSDEPAFDKQFHTIITARAMTYYANYESAPEIMKQGTELWQIFYPRLMAKEAPDKVQYYGRSDHKEIRVVAE